MAWTIKGVSGAALNATARTLAQLNIEAATLTFRSMAPDTLAWTARLTSPTGTGTIIPDEKQVVEIFDGSTRRFRGFVTQTRTGLQTVQVVCSNAWWLMEQTDLTQVRTDDSGATETRHKYVAPKGALATMTRDLIDRIIEIGIPIERGAVATMFPMTQTTLARTSCAGGLVQLLKRCPDAVTWFDYSGASGSDPLLKVARRGGTDAMSDITYTIGTDAIVRGETDITPRHDLRVKRVEVHYLDRHPMTGKIRFKKQVSGTGEPETTQKITVAGDELVSFIPKNDYDTYDIQTVASATTFVNNTESSLVSARKQYGSQVSIALFSGGGITWWKSYNVSSAGVATPNKDLGTSTVGTPILQFTNKAGKVLSLTGRYFVITDPVPEWVKKLPGLNVKEGTLSGMMSVAFCVDNLGTTTPETKVIPKWVTALGMSKFMRGWIVGTSIVQEVWAKPFSIPCTLVSVGHAGGDTLYKPPSYTFDELTPNDGMAEGLKIAQNWTPWQGRIVIASTAVNGENKLNKAINLAGALADCASMRALPKSLSYDLITQRMTWEIGPPSRLGFGTSSGRVPGSAQDLIEYTS